MSNIKAKNQEALGIFTSAIFISGSALSCSPKGVYSAMAHPDIFILIIEIYLNLNGFVGNATMKLTQKLRHYKEVIQIGRESSSH